MWRVMGLTLLVGCGGLTDAVVPISTGAPVRTVTFSDGLSVRAPSGYCARPALTKAQSGLSFAAFAPCNQTDQTFLTTAMRAQAAVAIADLPDPETAGDQVITRVSKSNPKLVQLKNPDLRSVQPVDPTFWRMVTYGDGYLVLANLYSAPGQSIPQARAERVLASLSWAAPDVASDGAQTVAYLPMARPWPKPKYRP